MSHPHFFGFPYVLILMSNPYFPLKLSNWNFPQEIFKSVFLLLWSKVEIDIGIQWLDKGIMTQWSNQKGKSFKILGPRPLWSEIIYICVCQKTLISLILTTSTPLAILCLLESYGSQPSFGTELSQFLNNSTTHPEHCVLLQCKWRFSIILPGPIRRSVDHPKWGQMCPKLGAVNINVWVSPRYGPTRWLWYRSWAVFPISPLGFDGWIYWTGKKHPTKFTLN